MVLGFCTLGGISHEPGVGEDPEERELNVLWYTKNQKIDFPLFNFVNTSGDDAHPLWINLQS